jgi:hypothetical protein
MNPPPLTWRRATFYVPIKPPGENETIPYPVAGIVSGPFGIFRGNTYGPDRGSERPTHFSLVLLECGRFLCSSATQAGCRVLAEELAPLDVAWTAGDVNEITGPGIERAKWLLSISRHGMSL